MSAPFGGAGAGFSGALWPLPVTLPVTPGDGIAEGKPLALRDVYGNLLAFLHVEDDDPATGHGAADRARLAFGKRAVPLRQ